MLPELEKIIQADAEAVAAVEQARMEAQSLVSRASERVKAIQAELAAARAELEKKIREDTVAQAEGQAQEILAATQRYRQGLQEKTAARRQEVLAWFCQEVLT
jgi:vacuolar-type H+-ATPase subunit H